MEKAREIALAEEKPSQQMACAKFPVGLELLGLRMPFWERTLGASLPDQTKSVREIRSLDVAV